MCSTPKKLDNYVNVHQVAKELGVSCRRIQTMCKRGMIKHAYKVNREWIIKYPLEFSKGSYKYHKIDISVVPQQHISNNDD